MTSPCDFYWLGSVSKVIFPQSPVLSSLRPLAQRNVTEAIKPWPPFVTFHPSLSPNRTAQICFLQLLCCEKDWDACFDLHYLHANSSPGEGRHVARSAPLLIVFGGHQNENASKLPERHSIFPPLSSFRHGSNTHDYARVWTYCHSAAVSGQRGEEMMQERREEICVICQNSVLPQCTPFSRPELLILLILTESSRVLAVTGVWCEDIVKDWKVSTIRQCGEKRAIQCTSICYCSMMLPRVVFLPLELFASPCHTRQTHHKGRQYG